MSITVQELIDRLKFLDKPDAEVLIDKKEFDTIMVEGNTILIKSKKDD